MRFRRLRTAWRFVRRPKVLDIAIAVLLAAISAPGLFVYLFVAQPAEPDLAVASVCAVGAALCLIVRRRRPLLVGTASASLDVLSVLLGSGTLASPISWVAFYSVGRYRPGGTAWRFALAVAVAEGVAITAAGQSNQVGNTSLLLVAVGLGQYLRLRQELRERRESHAAEAAVRAERRRIARELHDVVAHHITVINVLVGAGRTTLATDPERAQDVLVTAERTAREAMAEMRQLLHVLRADGEEQPDGGEGGPAGEGTGVGSAELPALIEQARQSGLPASLEVRGDAAPLPAAVDHAVYRIVQEALTNTRKHAPGARTSVRLAYLPGSVEVEALDDGSGPAKGDGDRGGFGLSGMAERVALVGGQLQTGPRPAGGFRVHARIPVPARAKENH